MLEISYCGYRRDIGSFYRTRGNYEDECLKNDTFVIAVKDGCVVGALRLCYEEDVHVLRSMEVAPDHQRQGIGKEMLKMFNRHLGRCECWGIALAHLEKFYGRIDFRFVSDTCAPLHLRRRLYHCRIEEKRQNIRYKIMHRQAY